MPDDFVPPIERCAVCDAPATIRLTFPSVDRVLLMCDEHAADVARLASEVS